MAEEKEKLKSLSPLVGQMVLRNLGMYCSERLSVDIYYLVEAINLMIPDMGEEFVKKKYVEQGGNWEDIKKKLDSINKQVIKAKVFYDAIEDKRFRKIARVDPEKTIQKFFHKTASKIAIMQQEIYGLFVFLVKISEIQRRQIKNESFKILEHVGFRKIDTTKRPQQQSSEPVVSEGS